LIKPRHLLVKKCRPGKDRGWLGCHPFSVIGLNHSLPMPESLCPRQGVIEASITVVFPYKVRAAALRLEGIDGRWRVTAFGLIT